MTEEFLTKAFIRLRGSMARSGEDALQEAFCRLWERKYRIRSEPEAISLLARTSRNLTIDAYRRRKRRPTIGLEGRQWEDAPDDSAARETLFKRLEASLEKDLTPIQRQIVTRHEYEGATFETIAGELNMQPAAVRMQISRARKALRNKFRQEDEDE